MPGFEWIGAEERAEIDDLFTKANGVFFRLGFDQLRNGVFKVLSFEKAFKEYMGATHALAVSSGTAALRVALAALGVGPGDEVITQAFTFVATAEAIVECGATPIIVDINETLNMCPESLARALTPRTKAVIVVHMLGTPAEMTAIRAITEAAALPLIEDTAWGCGASYEGKKLGTIGNIGTYSFDYAKAITTGEGGMVVTNDQHLDFRARSYHDHGHENNPALPRWEDSRHGSGFNFRMSELNAAVGIAQLRKLDAIVERQRQIRTELAGIVQACPGVTLRHCPVAGKESAEALVFFTESPAKALEVRRGMLELGVGTKILPEAVTWHFAKAWTHIPSLVKAAGGDLTKVWARSEALLRRAVALPINLKMGAEVPGKVHEALHTIFGA